jgi:succinyl-diaminopimelate desuccinylase
MWRLHGVYSGIISSLDCGVQCNVVSPVAKAVFSPGFDEEAVKEKIKNLGIHGEVRKSAEELSVTVYGKAAHASRPWDGHSATVDMLRLLAECGDNAMRNLYDCFCNPYGGGIGIQSEKRHDYTTNLGIFRIYDGICYGEVDARYPYYMTALECTQKLKEHCVFDVSLDYDSPPTMNDTDDPYVNALLTAYREETGDYREPFVSGGVSYSKIFGHCVAFGPMLPESESLAHQANESIEIDNMITALNIYYKAMKELAKGNFV